MITLLLIIVATLVALWAMWVMFVAVMHLRRVKNKWGLTTEQKVCGVPLLVIAGVVDFALRQFPFTLFFWRPPARELVSDLLEREAKSGEGWRRAQARWWREDFLADFDLTGSHGEPGRG